MVSLRNAVPAGLEDVEFSSGQVKQTYYRLDGRKVLLPPRMVTWVRRDNKGREIETGIRDANLDSGLMLSSPEHPKPHCPHCDKWHDTEAEVNDCGKKRAALFAKQEKQAKKELRQGEEPRLAQLEKDMSEIKNLLQKLAKGVK